jgi:homospermidine synthase
VKYGATVHITDPYADPEKGQAADYGEVPVRLIAKELNYESFAALLDTYLNTGGRGFAQGKKVGTEMRDSHRTLQNLAVCFVLGVVVGLSDQQYTDPRNATSIATAKKIARMLEKGELSLGGLI